MMGLPSETPADFEQSVRLAMRLTKENPKASKTFNIYFTVTVTGIALSIGLAGSRR